MEIKLIKLIQSELIKIFKTKGFYIILTISILAMVIYNIKNPEQNSTSQTKIDINDINISTMEYGLNNLDSTSELYIEQKVNIEFYKLFNSFSNPSWQRYALNEERTTNAMQNVDSTKFIILYLHNIYDYELNPNSNVSIDLYWKSKLKYDNYINSLKSNNWQEYINLKIEDLEELKSYTDNANIDFEIEYYKLRLDYNINFDYDYKNQYLEQYKNNYYLIEFNKNNPYNESATFNSSAINDYKERMMICKYAIENNLNKDISNENNLIYKNKIDARISLIRTFKYFEIIAVIMAIYVSTLLVVEEFNKGTIKNVLIKPHKRIKILISKILACLIAIIFTLTLVCIIQYFIGGFIYGFNSYELEYICYNFNDNQIITMNIFKYLLLVALTKIPIFIIIILFCILIGILSKHTSLALILTLIIFFASNTLIAEWAKVEKFSKVSRYFITMNWDFSKFLFGRISDISGINIAHSLMIYVLHFILLFGLSVYCFNKKDVLNNK